MVAIDTNIWIYYFTGQDESKRELIRRLLASLSVKGIIISNQILKEIAKVLSVNLNLNVENTLEALSNLEKLVIIRQ